MITPFDASGGLDLSTTRRLAAWLVDEQDHDGLVIAGTTGESPTLSDDEKDALLDAVLDEVGDRAAIIMGAGTFDTAETVARVRRANQLGACGVMVVNPYYSRPNQEGLYAHFAAAAESSQVPVMIYNIASRSAVNLETPTLIRLMQIARIGAVKEASGSLVQISEACAAAPVGFSVYCGDDALTLPALSVGACGVISVAGHVAGPEIAAMVDAFAAGNHARAQALHYRLLPLISALFACPNPVPVKHVLAQRGFGNGSVRLPLVPLEEAESRALATASAVFTTMATAV